MKKMLAKAVALSLVLGGVGFVANDALAADIGPAVDVETIYGDWDKVLSHKDGQAINAEVATNEANIATNKANIAKNAENISANQKAIDKEVKDRQDAITQERNARTVADLNLGEQITQEKNARIDADKAEAAARKDADKALSDRINQNAADITQEALDRASEDNRLQNEINQKADKTTVAENTAAIESNKAAIAQEKKDRDHADQKLQDQITINKGQIENEATNRANEDKRIEGKFDGEVSRLDGRIDKLNDNVQKVGAMAAAIANLHTMGYDPEAPTEIAVGVGQYRDKTGLALGAFHYPNRDFMLSFNVSTAGDEFMGGIGATWKFGRKSPEELRQAEAEKAAKAKLAKAEAAKKAAKDARVAAQQKRHAEMLAARTGK